MPESGRPGRGRLRAGAPGSDFLQLDASGAPPRGVTDWLVAELRSAVLDGRLPHGARLPPTRALAAEIGTSRGVVVEAYQRLREEGMVSTRVGSGTVISAPSRLPTAAAGVAAGREAGRPAHDDRRGGARPAIDLSPGTPDAASFPRAVWLRHERAVLDHASTADLGYGDPQGHPVLRGELAGWLARTRGLRVGPDDILVVTGVAQSLALLGQVLRSRDRCTLAVEDPGSRGARDELVHWGMRCVGIPVDERGLRVDRLAATDADAVLVTPAHQFPTGVLLHPERRHALLDWAAAPERLVIEDDYDAELRYDRSPVPAVQSAAPDRVAHTGSVSKTLMPGIRLGWLVAPRGWRHELAAAKDASDHGSPAISQLVLARLIASGDLDGHVRRSRLRNRQRRDALVTAIHEELPTARIGGIAAGLHVLITFPGSGLDDVRLAERSRESGLIVHPLSWHRIAPGEPGLVLGYGGHPPQQLRRAVARLRAAVGG